jgi:hypothetical protein
MADTIGRLIYEMRDAAADVRDGYFDAPAAIKAWADRLAALQAQQPRKYRGVGELERSGYIPAGSADEREAQQPGAQAVAWHTDDHLTDKSATTYDPVIAERWRAKGWPVTPHYLAPQPPSIPEPSDADVDAAYAAHSTAWMHPRREQIRVAITTDRARLRERIGGGA